MKAEDLRPIRCQSCGKLICEADGTVVFRCPRCKRRSTDPSIPTLSAGSPAPGARPASGAVAS